MAGMSPLRRRMLENMTIRDLSPATRQPCHHPVAKVRGHIVARRSPFCLSFKPLQTYIRLLQ